MLNLLEWGEQHGRSFSSRKTDTQGNDSWFTTWVFKADRMTFLAGGHLDELKAKSWLGLWCQSLSWGGKILVTVWQSPSRQAGQSSDEPLGVCIYLHLDPMLRDSQCQGRHQLYWKQTLFLWVLLAELRPVWRLDQNLTVGSERQMASQVGHKNILCLGLWLQNVWIMGSSFWKCQTSKYFRM